MIFELDIFNYWFWFALAAALIILEVLMSASFFLLWLGIVSFIIGIITWIFPSLTWEYQILVFAIGSIASIILWIQYLKRHPTKTDKPNLNKRSAEYVGRTFILAEPIVNGRGKIKVGDSIWRVEAEEDLPLGAQVVVIAANGTLLKVKAAGSENKESSHL